MNIEVIAIIDELQKLASEFKSHKPTPFSSDADFEDGLCMGYEYASEELESLINKIVKEENTKK